MDKDKICKMCEYLDGFNDRTIKNHLNDSIKNNVGYADLCNECSNSHAKNYVVIPPKYSFDKHKRECLKDYKIKTPINSIVQNTTVSIDVNKNQVSDSFKQKTTLNKICYIQEIMFEVLYKQAHYLNNNAAKVIKSDVDSIKSLMDIVLCNYLDFSKVEISSDKNQLNNVSIDMLNKVFSSSLVNNNDILDIVKLLFKADFQKENNYADEFTNVEEQLEEIKTTKEYLEYKTNNSA